MNQWFMINAHESGATRRVPGALSVAAFDGRMA
jgi:hypothetical protein